MWVVTKDHLEGLDVSVQSVDFTSNKECPHIFRMFDDDGFLYYTGYSSTKDDEAAFRPLDEYGEPNAGATEIRYLEDGKWETL